MKSTLRHVIDGINENHVINEVNVFNRMNKADGVLGMNEENVIQVINNNKRNEMYVSDVIEAITVVDKKNENSGIDEMYAMVKLTVSME